MLGPPCHTRAIAQLPGNQATRQPSIFAYIQTNPTPSKRLRMSAFTRQWALVALLLRCVAVLLAVVDVCLMLSMFKCATEEDRQTTTTTNNDHDFKNDNKQRTTNNEHRTTNNEQPTTNNQPTTTNKQQNRRTEVHCHPSSSVGCVCRRLDWAGAWGGGGKIGWLTPLPLPHPLLPEEHRGVWHIVKRVCIVVFIFVFLLCVKP